MRSTLWSLFLFLAASPALPQSSSSVQPKEIVSFDLDAIDRGVNAKRIRAFLAALRAKAGEAGR